MTFLIAIGAFFNSLGLNWFYAKSVLAVSEHDRLAAANWTALICGCSLAATFVVVEKNCLGIVAALLGAWLGTYISVKKPSNFQQSNCAVSRVG
jgi:hypothetical protein